MARALAHRGPDDEGIEVIGSVGLVARRLAIVDPTPAGHQPMGMPDGSWWLAYNGEVFNHLELRGELEGDWRSGSDTETVLRALAAWGEDAVPRCNGLFAWAALDARAGQLLLVRDRFGVKPLYLARHGGALWFASEVGALLAAGVPARADPAVLAHSVAYGWAVGARTPLEGVERVEAGTIASVDLDTLELRSRRWYDPAAAVDPERGRELSGLTRSHLVDAVEAEVRASVHRRLMSDVPLGTMCSGGVDSGLITAFAREQDEGVVAFNVGVPDQPNVDESRWAERVAAHVGVELRSVDMTAHEWRAGLVPAVRHNEFPLIHESSVPMAMIAARARDSGVKVLLSGEGADELFAGYAGLHRSEWRAFQPRALRLRQHAAATLARTRGVARRRASGLGHAIARRLERPSRGAALEPPLAPSSAARERDVLAAAAGAYRHHPGPRGRLEAALLSDLLLYLPHLLNRQDKNTMEESVETRVPFLDPAVVALSLNLPLEARVQPHRKGVLRDLAERHLPPGVAERPKLGFGFDVRRYFAGAARPEFLADGRLRAELEVPRDEWLATTSHLSWHHALRFWTGEVWCRLFLEGSDDDAVESALWR
jgi:asparagine synthase (glutamine-hydrolysing)